MAPTFCKAHCVRNLFATSFGRNYEATAARSPDQPALVFGAHGTATSPSRVCASVEPPGGPYELLGTELDRMDSGTRAGAGPTRCFAGSTGSGVKQHSTAVLALIRLDFLSVVQSMFNRRVAPVIFFLARVKVRTPFSNFAFEASRSMSIGSWKLRDTEPK
jgi:hypothetical protein